MYGIYPPAYNIKMSYMRTLCWPIYVLVIKCCRLEYEYIRFGCEFIYRRQHFMAKTYMSQHNVLMHLIFNLYYRLVDKFYTLWGGGNFIVHGLIDRNSSELCGLKLFKVPTWICLFRIYLCENDVPYHVVVLWEMCPIAVKHLCYCTLASC